MLKDSRHRRDFETGAVRDMTEGKGRCDLLPACALIRPSKHYENGEHLLWALETILTCVTVEGNIL